MNKVDKFKMAAKSALISAVVVPAMGVVAHLMPGSTFPADEASLSDRFECAYKWNPRNKTYLSYDYKKPGTYSYVEDIESGQRKYMDSYEDAVYDDSWIEQGYPYDKICIEEKYFAHPLITYPMYLAVAGLAYAGMRRRRKENMINVNPQKTR